MNLQLVLKNSENFILKSLIEFKDLSIVAIFHNLELINIFDKIFVIEKEIKEMNPNEFKIENF